MKTVPDDAVIKWHRCSHACEYTGPTLFSTDLPPRKNAFISSFGRPIGLQHGISILLCPLFIGMWAKPYPTQSLRAGDLELW